MHRVLMLYWIQYSNDRTGRLCTGASWWSLAVLPTVYLPAWFGVQIPGLTEQFASHYY